MTIQKLKQRKLGNSGFSLVELIIVIAIMAILIAVLAPMFIRYVERSRISTDLQAAGQMAGALKTALADPTLTPPDTVTLIWGTDGSINVSDANVEAEVFRSVGDSVQMRSSAARLGAVTITVTTSTGAVNVPDHASAGGTEEQRRFNDGLQDLDIA